MTTVGLESLKEKITKYKNEVKTKGNNINHEELRTLHKELKRAQRKYNRSKPETIQETLSTKNKLLALVSGKLTEMQKAVKKAEGNPFIKSLHKKTKSLNKQIKRLNKIIERQKPKEASSQTAAIPQPPQQVAEPANQ